MRTVPKIIHKTILLTVCLLLGVTAASAETLADYLESAVSLDANRNLLELQKAGSEMQLELGNLEQEEDSGTEISSSSVTVSTGQDNSGDYIVNLTPEVSVTLYDLDTEIGISGPVIINATDGTVGAVPEITVTKEIDTWEAGDDGTQDDLNDRISIMEIERSYATGLINIEVSVLSSLRTIISMEKQVAATSKSILDSKTDLEKDLLAGLIREGSTPQTQREHAVKILENSLTSISASLDAAKEDFSHLTGLTYGNITEEDLPLPAPGISLEELGNGSVLKAALELQVARQKLADELKSRNDDEIEENSINYLIDGSYTAALNNPVGTYEHTIQGGVSASFSDWTFGTGVTAVIDNGGIEPSGYISGSWRHPDGEWEEYDTLELDILNNAIALSEAAYEQEIQDYRDSVRDLQLDIADWELERAELALEAIEYQQLLEDAEYAVGHGFGTADEAADARHDLAQLEYDRAINIIDGLILERSCELLQL